MAEDGAHTNGGMLKEAFTFSSLVLINLAFTTVTNLLLPTPFSLPELLSSTTTAWISTKLKMSDILFATIN